MTSRKKIYIPGLNGVRAIAAIVVLFSHIDQFAYKFGMPGIGFFEKGLGGYGVTMFFTLSGFLITYLLLLEKESRINIRRFYVRRILRIWPIYYLAILITILILPLLPQKDLAHVAVKLSMYVFFLPNLAYAMDMTLSTINPLWSVGVEEQFYLFWPWLVRGSRNTLKASLLTILFYLLIKLLARYSGSQTFYYFIWETRIDCMAMGAVGACLVYESKDRVLAFFFHRLTQVLAWLFLLFSVIFGSIHLLTFVDQEVYSLVFLTIIINVGFNRFTLVTLENPVLDFLGKISYGIYVYHMLVIFLLAWLFDKYSLTGRINVWSFYLLIISFSLLVAYLSFRYFEKYFLSLKSKYAIVNSTNTAPIYMP